MMFLQHCRLNILAWRYNSNPWFMADWFNFLENRIIDYFVTRSINLYSYYLAVYLYHFSYINIAWCNSFPKAWGEAKAKLPWQLWELMGTLKSGFDSNQGFPHESPSHIVYKVPYVNSFYSLYYYHHYDHCI